MKSKELRQELERRGTAELNNGIVNQVTQAISEEGSRVEYLMFGEMKKQSIIPIERACFCCNFWRGEFNNRQACQDFQSRGAKAKGFNEVICPNQLY